MASYKVPIFALAMFSLIALVLSAPQETTLLDQVTQVFTNNPLNNLNDCIWKGTSPFCDGGCNVKGHVVREVSATGNGERCLTGIKVLCCPSTPLNL